MKVKTYFLLIFISTTVFGQSNLIPDLKGNPSSYKHIMYKASGDSISPVLKKYAEWTNCKFDKKGKLDSSEKNRVNGIPILNIGYTDSGDLQFVRSNTDSTYFTYNQYGLLKKEVFKKGVLTHWKNNTYDRSGNKIKHTSSWPESIYRDSTIYRYRRSFLSESILYVEGKLKTTVHYSYHKNGKKATKVAKHFLCPYPYQDSIVSTEIDTFDMQGVLLETRTTTTYINWHEKPKNTSSTELRSSEGIYVEEPEIEPVFPKEFDRSTYSLQSSKKYIYDQARNLIAVHQYDDQNTRFQSKYMTYDEYGNCIKEASYAEGKIVFLSEYEITYF